MESRNLDLDCALAGGRIGRQFRSDVKKQDLEGLYTSSAAVLAENGPYAMFLYLWSRRDKNKGISETLREGLYLHVCQAVGWNPGSAAGQPMLESVARLSEDFNRLLLVRKVLGQTLSYLRYHAKALAAEPDRRKAARA